MKAEIISVGNEVLSGSVVNTDTSFLARRLTELGFTVQYQTTVADDRIKIQKALSAAVKRSAVIVFTGGLGPTPDDITREAVCDAVGKTLVCNDTVLEQIRERLRKNKRHFVESNKKQAFFPADATIFPNDRGTAAGFAMRQGRQHILLLPGPFAELKAVFENGGACAYLSQLSTEQIFTRSIYVFGLGESYVAEQIQKHLERENPYVATYVADGEVEVRITARDADAKQARRKCDFVANDICHILGKFAYSVDEKGLESVVVRLLKKLGKTVATAESCTAGLVSARITDISGASTVFKMGVVAYSDAVKQMELNVKSETLETFSAVSAEVAQEMAIGIRLRSGADLGVSVTGVAGPNSDDRGNPVGLVYVALTDGVRCWVRKLDFRSAGSDARERIRLMAASNALDLVRCYLAVLPNVLEGGEPLDDAPIGIELPQVQSDVAIAPIMADLTDDEPQVLLGPSADETEGEMLPIIPLTPFDGIGAQDILSDRAPLAAFPVQKEEKNDHPFEQAGVANSSDLFSSSAACEQVTEVGGDQAILAAFEDTFADVFANAPNAAPAALSREENKKVGGAHDAKPISHTRKKKKKKKKKKPRWALFLPRKGDGSFEIMRKMILCLSVLICAACIAVLGVYGTRSVQNTIVNNNTKDLYGNTENVTPEKMEEIGFPESASVDFVNLYAENDDTIGWVKIDGTKIDNVVVRGSDNEYYLDRTFYHKWNDHGTVFMDYRCTVTNTVNSQNLILYGHHMRDGSMFNSLKNFKNQNFLREHQTISFNTLYSKDVYEIFAVIITNDYPPEDNGYRFDYNRTDFSSDEDFAALIDGLKKRSLFNTGVQVDSTDELLTLSTCIYDFNEARLVVIAKKLDAGESPSPKEQIVRKANKDVLFPQAWYDKKGGKKPSWA